eukprot:10705325-Ditylum_brightwellii.AAC.1
MLAANGPLDAVNISVTRLRNVHAHVKCPESFATTLFVLWLLSIKAKNGEQLFTSIEKDCNDYHYFCTIVLLKEEACEWIDALEDLLGTLFTPNELDKVTTGENTTRSYRIRESEHAKEGATAYKNYFAQNNVD